MAYISSVGLIYNAKELIDVLGTSNDDILEEDMSGVDFHTAPHQLAAALLSHLLDICTEMEAVALQKATALEDSRRREDVVIHMKAASI